MSETCRSCRADIVWAISAATGKRMPLDALPTDDGNLAVRRDPTQITAWGEGVLIARVLGDDEKPERGEHRGTSHFATCPNADKHRRRKSPAVTCKTVDVDGTTVLVRGRGELTQQDRDALAEVVAAAKRKFEVETG